MIIAVNAQLLIKDELEGIGRFAHETLKRITVQHPEHTFYFIFDRPYSDEFIYSNNVVPIILSPPSRHPVLWALRLELLMPRLLKKIKADIYYSPDGWSTTSTAVKTIDVIHDINFFHDKKNLRFLTQRYLDYYFPRFAKNATKICTVSNYSKQDIVKNYNISPEKIQVVCNGSSEIFKPIGEDVKQEVKGKFTNGFDYFVYVGALNPRKNLLNLLKAFELFKSKNSNDVKLLIVGAKMIWRKDIEKVYLSMSYKEDVVFTGRVSNDDLHLIMASALALTYVSFYEGFGIPILEAMNCDVPVITSNTTSMPEVAGDAAVLVNPYSVEDIEDALAKVYLNSELRAQLITNGRIQREKYSWQKSADSVWTAIEEVISQC